MCAIIAFFRLRSRGCLCKTLRAEVAELADALASGASPSNRVEVRVLSSAPFHNWAIGQLGNEPMGLIDEAFRDRIPRQTR